MVWGTFLEKNFPSSNGHLLDFGGGSKPLPGWFGALIQRKNGKKMVKRVKNGKNGKIAPEKKCPRVPV